MTEFRMFDFRIFVHFLAAIISQEIIGTIIRTVDIISATTIMLIAATLIVT